MKNEFSLFLPVDGSVMEKSIEGDEKGNYVRGWASTPDMDKQGDIIDPNGIDISEFLDSGWINYEHESDSRIGIPTKNCFVDPQRGLYVEAKLLMERPKAKDMWDKAELIAKSGSNRPIGFSVEGIVTARDSDNPAIIRAVKITDIALTVRPANVSATWEMLVKSMTTGTEINPEAMSGASALRIQELSEQLYNLSFGMKGISTTDVKKIAKSLDDMGRYDSDVAITLLQIGYGLSRDSADMIMRDVNTTKEEK